MSQGNSVFSMRTEALGTTHLGDIERLSSTEAWTAPSCLVLRQHAGHSVEQLGRIKADHHRAGVECDSLAWLAAAGLDVAAMVGELERHDLDRVHIDHPKLRQAHLGVFAVLPQQVCTSICREDLDTRCGVAVYRTFS